MLPATMALPPALKSPVVLMLPPATFPVALIKPDDNRFRPVMFPDAEIVPEELRFAPTTFPLTDNEVNVPTLVKLEFVTLELRVLPVISAAGALDTTPVSWLPLPMNNPPATTLPVALTTEFAISDPCTVAPVLETTKTLAIFDALMLTVESCTIWMFDVPFAIPVIPPMLKS